MRLVAILALAALPSLACAEGSAPLGGDFCYAKAPAAERRGEGPSLLLGPAPEGVPAAEGAVAVTLLLLPAPGRSIVALAECREDGDGRLDCAMEGDAGRFAVTTEGDGVVVWPGEDGLVFEDEGGFVTAWEGGGRAVTLAACPASGLRAFGQS